MSTSGSLEASASEATSDPAAASASSSSAARGPGRPPRQGEGDAPEVRERLLDAATQLAVEQGFEACGLREIAARAEVSAGMIAYYFGDRSGLFDAVFQRAFDRIAKQVRELMADAGLSGRDRLAELVRVQVSTIAADPWLPRLLMREVLSLGDSPLSEVLERVIADGPIQMMILWLQEEQANHGIRSDFDPRLLALTITSMAVFPLLVLPAVAADLGIDDDETFPARLIEHNQKLLESALRAPTEDER